MKRIDTHQHLWDCRQFPYAWCAGIPALNKSFLLEDYLLAAEGGGIEKTVFVECNVDAPHIEDLPPLHDIEVTLQLPVKSARLVPQGGDVTLEKSGDRVTLRVPVFSCHQMIEIECQVQYYSMTKLLSKFTVSDAIVRFDAPAENLSWNIPSFCNSIHVFPLQNRRARVLQSVLAG